MTAEGLVSVGDTVAGKYRVDRVLGQGAMGVVVLARHLLMETDVAIKFLMSNRQGEAEQRFMREARIAGKLKSQYAGKALDMGVTDNGARYIVMEYIDGVDLSELLDREGPLPLDVAILYVLQACHALAEAHSLGIVHRDIKPSNLMLTNERPGAPSIVKVLDFGVSKAIGALGVHGTEEAKLTATSQGLGSPLYMAPEQMNDAANVDGRADIWSLGVTLYQLLTGTTPWIGNTFIALVSAMVSKDPAPITDHRPGLPPGLWGVIRQCIERERDLRWPNVAALAGALAPYGPPESALLVPAIAARHGLPEVRAERATEPMPAPGEVSAYGFVGVATAPLGGAPATARPVLGSQPDTTAGSQRAPLASRPALASRPDTERPARPSRPDAAPVSVPARSSAEIARGPADYDRRMRSIAIGIPIVTAAFIAIMVARWALQGPAAVAGPIAVPPPTTPAAQTAEAPAPVVTPARSTVPIAAVAPSTAPPATAPISAATTRTKVSPRPVPVQPSLAAKGADLPDGPRH